MVASALVLLSGEWGMVVAAPATFILCRELGVSALREWMAEMQQRNVVKVSWAGKVKTTVQLTAISLLLFTTPPFSMLPSSATKVQYLTALTRIAQLGLVCLYGAALATAVSGFGYLSAAWPLLTQAE